MPRIPQGGIARASSGAIPTVDVTRGAGEVEEAFSGLGKDIQNIGLNLDRKRKLAEQSDYVAKESTQMQIDLQETARNLKTRTGVGAEGYEKAMREATSTKMGELELKSKPEHFQAAKSRLNTIANSFVLNANSHESHQKAKGHRKNLFTNFDTLGIAQVNMPDAQSAVIQLEQISQDIDMAVGTTVGPEEAIEIKSGALESHVVSLINGMDGAKQYEAALDLLNGKGKYGPPLIKRLSPPKLASLKKSMANKKKIKDQTSAFEINESIRDAEARVIEGQAVSERALAELEAKTFSIKDEAKRATSKNKVKGIKSLSGVMQSVYSMSSNDIDFEKMKLKGGLESASERRRLNNIMANLLNQDRKERLTNSAGYLVKHDQEIAAKSIALDDLSSPVAINDYATAVSAKQEAMGMPRQMLPREKRAQVSAMLTTGMAGQISERIDSLKAGFGENYNQALSEAASVKGFANPEILTAGYYDDKTIRNTLIQNSLDKGTINKAFKENPDLKAQGKLLTSGIEADISDFSDTLKDVSRKPFLNSMRSQVELNAKKLMSSGMKMSDAISDSVDLVINSNFNTISAGNSNILIPVRVGQSSIPKDIVEDYVDHFSDSKNLGKLNIAIPQGSTKELFMDQLEEEAKWETNPAIDGIRLVRFVRGIKVPVLDKDNNPVTSSFVDIRNNPFEQKVRKTRAQRMREFEQRGRN